MRLRRPRLHLIVPLSVLVLAMPSCGGEEDENSRGGPPISGADSDGDGINDVEGTGDIDGDGTPDDQGTGADGDGNTTEEEADVDNDPPGQDDADTW